MGQAPAKPTKPWVDQPFKIIESPSHRMGIPHPASGSIAFADEMTIVHNHLIRILNSIYLQAPNITQPQDIKDFTTYMHAWILLVHEHHANEENHFFPWLEEYIGKPGYMDVNVEQHHAFEAGMKELADYVDGLRDAREVYSGERVRAIIDGFGEVFWQHLVDEVRFLEGLKEFEDVIDWVKLGKRITDHAVKTADVEFVIPIMLMNGDRTWEPTHHDSYWPPFPFFVGWIFRYVHMPKQKGAWRFAGSDANSNPRDLAFV